MEKHKAIPQGYMTVGEVAKKMDITVRTLQHYDREGLLSPSSLSEGGRRLYTDKDIIKLHQIYNHPYSYPYNQPMNPSFIPYLAFIDEIFCCGIESVRNKIFSELKITRA